jgi:hypothetical protein
MTDVGYQKISQRVEWGVSSGKVETTILNTSTAIGLLLKF